MALGRRGNHRYGDSQKDIPDEIVDYSKANGYPVKHFAEAKCECGSKHFRLWLDDQAGAAMRRCVKCASERPIGDSDEYLDDAELEECACPCGHEEFQISAGVSLYEDSEDVRWIYLGLRCTKCGLTAVYGDWKNEFIGYRNLLARI